MSDFEEPMSISVFRALASTANTSKVANPKCGAKGCLKTTREGKPYCSTHVEHSPYVKRVLEELALRDQEANDLAAGLDISKNGHLVRETLLSLEQGSYTAAKLSRLMDISHAAAETLIRVICDKKLAVMGKTDRGALTIRRRVK